MWRSFLFSTAAAVFFSKEMTGSYLQVDHIWLQVSKTEKWQFLYFFCVWNAWVSAKDIGENFHSKQPCELQNIPELQQSWIKSREEGWSCPVRIRVAANQLQHTLTKTLGEGWSFHWCPVALCFTAYSQILLSQGRPSEMRIYSVVTLADMNLYFIDGTDSWTASLCHCICGRICHEAPRGPSKTAPSVCGTRWTTKKRRIYHSLSKYRWKNDRPSRAIPLDPKTWYSYCKRYKGIDGCAEDIWFGFKSTK